MAGGFVLGITLKEILLDLFHMHVTKESFENVDQLPFLFDLYSQMLCIIILYIDVGKISE